MALRSGGRWARGRGSSAYPHPIPAGAAGLSATIPQVKLTQELRVHLLEQLSGLQSKQQRDAELLEDIR